jgi:hypothetical protein
MEQIGQVGTFSGFTPQSPLQPATQTRLQSFLGVADPTRVLPDGARQALAVGDSPTPRIFKNLPDNLAALQRKYAELAPVIQQLPEDVRNTLVRMDSDRVAQGGKPLTREETIKLAQTWTEQQPATLAPERKPLNVPGNVLGDLAAIVKGIPQIPGAIVNEVRSLGQRGEGDNAISQFLNSPGIRMLPGSFVAAELSEGDVGELARHPLFTALDLLPAANLAAKGTRVGRLAVEAAEETGRNARPLAAALTQRVDESGALVDRAPRAALKELRDSTRIGQTMDQFFGARSRDVSRIMEQARMRVVNEMNGLEVSDEAVVRATQQAVQLDGKYRELYGWDEQRFADLTRKMQLGNTSDFTPEELAYRNEYREIVPVFAQETVDMDLTGMFDGEVYTREQATALRREAVRSDHYNATVALRDEWRSTGRSFSASDLDEIVGDVLSRNDTKLQRAEFRNLINVLDAYGYDVTEVRSRFRRFVRGNVEAGALGEDIRALVGSVDEATLRRRATPRQIVDAMNAVTRRTKDIQADRLARAVAKGDSAEITRSLNNILRRRSEKSIPLPQELIDDLRATRDMYREDVFNRQYTRSRADMANQRLRSLRARTPPARFDPVIGQYTREGVTVNVFDPERPGPAMPRTIEGANQRLLAMEEGHLGRSLTPDEVESLTLAIKERSWGSFRFGDHESVASLYQGIEGEVKRTWMDLRRAGVDPDFIHVTTRSRARGVMHPKPGPVPVGISQARERAIDMGTGINSPGVALSHQGMEILSRRASEDALDTVLQQYGVSERELRETYRVPARDLAERDPLFGFEGQLADIVRNKYVLVDLKNLGFDWQSARLSKYSQNAVFIPKAVHSVLGDIANPKQLLGGVFDPITKLFRVSVIGLSPRTHLYNVLGGATMLMGETGPAGFRYTGEAMRLARNPELIESVALRRIIGSQRAIMRDFDDIANVGDRIRKAEVIANVAGGRTLGRLWQEVQQSKVAKATGGVIDKSMDLNAFADDTYRIMAYLYGYDKALTKGMSKEVAERAGIELLQKTMMDWASLTPIERTVLKSVFPFYSFINHAIRYTLRYPVDHPVRAGVLGAFGRAMQDDMDGLLPDRFLSFFFFGSRDAEGNQKGFNVGPVNPFGDVANMMTFAGFLSATNPAILTTLEAVGLQRGEAELYPTLRYNPDTGRLDGTRSNPILGFITNTVPQTDILLSLMGAQTDLAERIQRDPAGATRTLWSAGGMPVLWREIEVLEEQGRAELARQDSQAQVLADALKSGNWQNANTYPGLAGVQQQVQALPPEVVRSFTPPESAAIRAQLEALLAGQQAQFGAASEAAKQQVEVAVNPIAQQQRIGGI